MPFKVWFFHYFFLWYFAFIRKLPVYMKKGAFLTMQTLLIAVRVGSHRDFSSPEPKAQVNYCHGAPTVVRKLFTFSISTPEPLFMKLSRNDVLKVLYKCCLFLPDPSRVNIGSRAGQNMSWGPLPQETSSSEQKATTTKRLPSNDLDACGKKCC